MAETSGPWDGSGFAQDEWRALYGSGTPYDGVLRMDDEEDGLEPTFSPSNREVTFSSGQARIRGNLYVSDSSIIVDVPAPSGSNQRIDYVVLRYDPSEGVLDDRITMQLVQGAESADPSEPALTKDHDGVWEHPLWRIGPFGTGAISGAPTQRVSAYVVPVSYARTNTPNDQLEGLSRVSGAWLIGLNGRLWRYETGVEQYVRQGDPQTGTISLSGGWSPRSSNPPRYWVKDGLVHLGGVIDTGSVSTFRLPSGPPGTKFTSSLPSAIRPGREMSLLGFGQVARSSGTTRHRQPIGIYYDSDNRLGIMDAMDPIISEQWMQSGGDIYLHGISWVIF